MTVEHRSSFVRCRFSDFEALAEVIAGWDLDWRQLDAGQLEAGLTQVSTDHAIVSWLSFDRRFFQSGCRPAGMRTYGLTGLRSAPTRAYGRDLGQDSLLAFGDDYTSISEPGFRGCSLSFSEEVLQNAAESEDLAGSFERLPDGRAVPCRGAELDPLRRRLRYLLNGLSLGREAVSTDAFATELNTEVPALLVRALVAGSTANGGTPRLPGNREVIAKKARELINERADEPPTIGTVSRLTGVSQRTLRYAFREAYGISPKRYLQALRLNRARRDLLRAAPDVLVAEVANRWGFWHMGQFASDYRKHFAELPSDTLARLS